MTEVYSTPQGVNAEKPHVTAVDDFNRSLRDLAEAVQHLDALAKEMKGHDLTTTGDFEAPMHTIENIIDLTPGIMREVGHRIDKIREDMVVTLKMA